MTLIHEALCYPTLFTIDLVLYVDLFRTNLLHDSVLFIRIIRNCVEPCTVEGMQFEKGNTIFVPVYNLHRDEEIWPEPEKFDPDRLAHCSLLVLSTDTGWQ